MKAGMQRILGGWIETLRSIGFFLLLIGGTGLLGFCISWPLWFFSMQSPIVYTFTVLALAGAGIVAMIVRAALRKRQAVEDLSRPRRTPFTVLLTFLIVTIGISGAFTWIAFFARRMWAWGAIDVLAWVAALWLLARVRRFAKERKARGFPAENISE